MPQSVPISEMKLNQPAVLALLKNGPVLLNSRSKATAVMVDVDRWNQTVDIIEDLSDTVDALRMELAIAKGAVGMMSQEEISEWLAEDALVPA